MCVINALTQAQLENDITGLSKNYSFVNFAIVTTLIFLRLAFYRRSSQISQEQQMLHKNNFISFDFLKRMLKNETVTRVMQ